MLPHASVMLLPVPRGRITASILLLFVCLNSCRLSGHLPRAALLAVGVWESPECILNDTTGGKKGLTKRQKGLSHPPPSYFPSGCSQRAQPGQWERPRGPQAHGGRGGPQGTVQMGGLSVYCLGKHRRGCLAHHRTAQNNKCLNDKGENTENNRTDCSSQSSAESRIPARPSPTPAPSLPVLGTPACQQEERVVCSWQCLPSSPSSCHLRGHFSCTLLPGFAVQVEAFQKRSRILLSASKAAMATAKS